jgi:hypothetical protein
VPCNLTFHHFALASTNGCHVDSDGASHRAVLSTVTRNVRDFRARNLILTGHAGDVGTGATDPPSLHNCSPAPCLRQVPSQEFTASSTAKDENFNPLWLRHALAPYLDLFGSWRGSVGSIGTETD